MLPREAVIICGESRAPCLNEPVVNEKNPALHVKRRKGNYRVNLPHGQKVSQTPKRPSIRASLMYGHAKFVKRLTKPGVSVVGATVDPEEPECVDSRRGRVAGSISSRVPCGELLWLMGIGRKCRIESREDGF